MDVRDKRKKATCFSDAWAPNPLRVGTAPTNQSGRAIINPADNELANAPQSELCSIRVKENLRAYWQSAIHTMTEEQIAALDTKARRILTEIIDPLPRPPKKAPKLYDPDRDGDIVAFLTTTYAKWLDTRGGATLPSLTRAHLRSLDPKAYSALTRWLDRNGNELPQALPLFTKAQIGEFEIHALDPDFLEHIQKLVRARDRRQARLEKMS